jgi:hypothetical protein
MIGCDLVAILFFGCALGDGFRDYFDGCMIDRPPLI